MNIILIGMPGSGKSTIGVVLAKTLCMGFVDTDLLIQDREDALLQEIINEKGIEGFLKIEEEALLSLDVKNSVIATGGSAIYSEAAMEHLKSLGHIMYLKLHYKVIERRIRNLKTRGIAMKKDKTIKDIYWERKGLYESYADFTIPCKSKSVARIVNIILGDLEKMEKDGNLIQQKQK